MISGTGGSVVKAGSGTETLSGNNTYTGNTTVNAGTLLVNNTSGSATGTGTVTVNSGGTLSGSGTAGQGIISGNVTVASGGNIASAGATNGLTLSGGLNLQAGSAANFTLLTPTGNGTPLINVSAGNLTVGSQNTINLTAGAGFAAGTYDLFHYTGSDPYANFTLATSSLNGFSCALQDHAGEVDLSVIALSTPDIWTGNGSDNNWGNATNWSVGVPTANNTAVFTGNATITTLGGNQSVGAISFNGSGNVSISGSGYVLTLGSSAAGITANGTDTIAALLTLNTNNTMTVSTGSILTISGNISSSGYGLTATGPGTLVLSGNNSSYTRQHDDCRYRHHTGHGQQRAGQQQSPTLSQGGTLQLSGNVTIPNAISANGTIVGLGSSGTNTITGNVTVGAGGVTFLAANSTTLSVKPSPPTPAT